MTSLPIPSQAPGMVDSDRNCARCGYSLRGLSAAGVCPECAEPVANSLREDLLKYSSPKYVAMLYLGVRLVLWSILISIVLGIGGVLLGLAAAALKSGISTSGLQLVIQVAGLGTAAMSLYGWFLISEADPKYVGDNPGTTPRRVIRAMVIVTAVLTVCSTGLVLAGVVDPIVLGALGIVNGIAGAVQFFASMIFLQWLAPRLPSDRVLRRSKRMMWLGPVLMTVGLVILIGPLIALVLYWNMLDWVRKDLKATLSEQAVG